MGARDDFYPTSSRHGNNNNNKTENRIPSEG